MTDVTDATDDDARRPTTAEPAAAPPDPSFSDFPIHADIVDALAEHGSPARSRSRR